MGQRVRLVRAKSVKHFLGVGMTIRGEILVVDPSHYDGIYHRPFNIRFDDGRTGWYAAKELKVI